MITDDGMESIVHGRFGEGVLPNRITAEGRSMTQTDRADGSWHQAQEKWSKIWFTNLCRFHSRKPQPTWEFTPEDAIAFLQDHLRRKTPAWKRLRIIDSLMYYRRHVQAGPIDDFKFIHTKLEALARAEKIKQMCQGEMDVIEDVVGHIDPKEPDVIQNLRRAIRGRHDKLETERAYVYNVRAFMRERGLKCQADFDKITAADIEAHLTDMAVDGDVAVSTQNRAFYALLYRPGRGGGSGWVCSAGGLMSRSNEELSCRSTRGAWGVFLSTSADIFPIN
ncbi:phage integrase N-terminal SAM-like domain-containing protein [Neorhodopirellula pilleata]|uniref:Integrase SAM-like N-terminal domain-containing protein n=1 Tax=Neorhodopirellula pilleata TaxID=2714738 RepID=A0A5C6AAN1_9BACT|nr:phage integrase N-terminal SAM-like domain-containing protein [Neorhodopirellula pilleata]TWT96460.1 hypothetical protein Pla100_29400 [Neorhodopirellula pilleata]